VFPSMNMGMWWEILYRSVIYHIYRRLSDGLFIKRYDL